MGKEIALSPIYFRDAVYSWHGLRKNPLRSPRLSAPFFIVGSGRSGNTLLRRLLVQKFKIYIPPETYVIGPTMKRIIRNPRMNTRAQLEYICDSLEAHPDFKYFPTQTLDELRFSIQDESIELTSTADVYNEIYRFLGSKAGVNFLLWGDKTPYNAYFLPQIHLIFPHSRYIWLLRHPYDVILSYLEAKIYTSIEDAARRWVSANRQILKYSLFFPSQVHCVKYEELTEDVDACLHFIENWLGAIRRPDEIIELTQTVLGDVGALDHHSMALQPVTISRRGRGANFFSTGEKKQIKKIAEGLSIEFGYEL